MNYTHIPSLDLESFTDFLVIITCTKISIFYCKLIKLVNANATLIKILQLLGFPNVVYPKFDCTPKQLQTFKDIIRKSLHFKIPITC